MTGGVCLVLATHLGPLSSQEERVLQAHILDPSMAQLVLHWCVASEAPHRQLSHSSSCGRFSRIVSKTTSGLASPPLRQAFPWVTAVLSTPARQRGTAGQQRSLPSPVRRPAVLDKKGDLATLNEVGYQLRIWHSHTTDFRGLPAAAAALYLPSLGRKKEWDYLLTYVLLQ